MKPISLAFLACFLASAFAGCGRGKSKDKVARAPLWQSAAGLTEVHSDPPESKDFAGNDTTRRVLPSGFSGSQRCAECHAERTQSFLETAHARSGRFIEATEVNQGRTWDDVSRGRRLHAEVGKESMTHQVTRFAADDLRLSNQTAMIAYEFGSGTHAHTYAFRDGVFWCESPLSWYAGGVGWDLSPGFETRENPEFDRAITNRCVFCHVGAIEQVNHSPHEFEIRQAAIGCERCHGGGQEHIQYHSLDESDRADIVDPIVNPARLSFSAAEAVCTQCHLQGDQLIVENRTDVWDFVPGQAIEQNRTDFRLRGGSGNRIVGHTEQLRQSRCYTQSKQLTCVSCHDPHGEETTARTDIYRNACLECHGDDSCGVEQSVRISTNENDCSACHMPKQATDVVHAALHQHRIGIYAESYPAGVTPDRPPLDFEGEPPQPASDEGPQNLFPVLPTMVSSGQPHSTKQFSRRDALAVYNAVLNGASGPGWEGDLSLARNGLIQQLKDNPTDRSVRTALAREYLNYGRVDEAERLLKYLVADQSVVDRPGIQAIAILAEIRLRQRNSVRAKPLYQRLTTLRRVSGDHYLHGLCCVNTGDSEGAIRSFREALRIDPQLAAAHQQLAVIFASIGEVELAKSHEQAVGYSEKAVGARP